MSTERDKRFLPTVPLLLITALLCAAAGAGTVYVDDDAPVFGDGSSWETAYKYLQDALAEAEAAEEPVEIRVAQGTYMPDQGHVDTSAPSWRFNAAFELGDGLTLKGGYAGVAGSDPDERDIQRYETALSGDLDGDDVDVPDLGVFLGDPGCKYENSATVVRVAGDAVIEGCTIAGAAQIGYFQHIRLGEPVGGGLCVHTGQVIVRRCTFRQNLNRYDGAAICGENLRISNCTFEENHAGRLGGAACIAGSMDDCAFTDNHAWYSGAVAVLSPGLVATSCLFVGNSAVGDGGAARGGAVRSGGMCDTEQLRSGTVAIANSTFRWNEAKNGAAVYIGQTGASTASLSGSAPNLRNCVFEGNAAAHCGGALHNLRGDVTLDTCVFVGNSAASRGGAVYMYLGTLASTGCTFKANAAGEKGGAVYYEHTNLSAAGCVFVGNAVRSGTGRGGAMANYASNTTLENCLFAGNAATAAGGGIWDQNGSSPSSAWPPLPTHLRSVSCTFADNRAATGGALASSSWEVALPARVVMENCLLWSNADGIWNDNGSSVEATYCNIQGGWPGEGNMDANPCFADPGHWDPNGTPDDPNDDFFTEGDYHLNSRAGRWDPAAETWVIDDVTSPCIDAGDPNSAIGYEPFPNGGRINMGVYGGTAEASRSPSGLHARYGGGAGEPNDPYLIYTAEQLNAIGTNADDLDKHFKLMADIDLNVYQEDSFNVIGYYRTYTDTPFSGVFDGNGRKIANFSYTSTDENNTGLFGRIEGADAEIKSLGLVDPSIDAGRGSRVGALVGDLISGTISNCYAQGGSVSGEHWVGGLVGVNHGMIINCCSDSIVSGSQYVGGLTGHNRWDGTIANCYSTASVSGDYYVGGLVGQNDGRLTDCYAMSRVSGGNGVGGLVGLSEAWPFGLFGVTNCYSTGIVSGDALVGGLVGWGGSGITVRDSLWDTETSGQKTSAGGTGRATAEMQTGSTFLEAGWDFAGETDNGTEDIWWILEGRGYPRLWWERGDESPL